MKISVSWLREFISLDISTKELANTLTVSGLEVNSINDVAPYFSSVVVGEILSCKIHPNADKLKLCLVNIGTKTLPIICGANNVRVGLKVAVARVGSILPNDVKIKKVRLRGVDSIGMICSKQELGIADESDKIMELDDMVPVGVDVRSYLNLDDKIIDFDLTPNRGDCFSVFGIARELGVIYNKPVNKPVIKEVITVGNDTIKTQVIAKEHCPKYCIRIIKDLDNTKPTPKWMKDKLTRSGLTSHSAIVDITNFVLLELGQPLHSFDFDKIDGDIIVRLAKPNEDLVLLNESTVSLTDDTLVIADANQPIAIAGIMGGAATSTTLKTSTIALEGAFFDNKLIAGKARKYNLQTESSIRFERGVDYNGLKNAINRATQLILDICGGVVTDDINFADRSNFPVRNPVQVNFAMVNQILGIDLPLKWISEKVKLLQFDIHKKNATQITIIPPSFRFDISIEADVIEEFARIYGYNKLPVHNLQFYPNLTKKLITEGDWADNLVARGYHQVINYSFISSELADIFGGSVSLVNPISQELQIMRFSLLSSLAKNVIHNQKYGQKDFKIFEIGNCFCDDKSDGQIKKIAALITGKTPHSHLEPSRDFDFYDIKADLYALTDNDIELIVSDNKLLQPGQQANILIKNKCVGFIGALNPNITRKLCINKCFVFELNFSALTSNYVIKCQELSNYQLVRRDISVLISTRYSYKDITSSIYKLKQQYLIDIKLLDVWTDATMEEGQHSLTFSISYGANNKTLTEQDINFSVNKVLLLLRDNFNAKQR